MSLTLDDVKKIAHLARLDLSEADHELYKNQLSNIMQFIEQMSAVNTDNILPQAHPLDLSQRLREDIVTEQDLRDKYQKIAPATDAGLYLVPKVIE